MSDVAVLGALARPGPGGTTACSSSRRVLVAHWRAVLAALRLAGVLGCSGWPPRWSRRWTRYGCATLVAFTAARVALFTRQFFLAFKPQVEEARKGLYPGEMSYIFWLDTFNLGMQGLTISLTQVVMLLYSRDVSLLVRAVFLYLHSFPGPRNKNAHRHAAMAWFGANFTFYAVYGMSYTHFTQDDWERVFYILNDLLPHVLIGATQDSFLHIVAANVDLLASVADGVLEHVAALSHLAQSAAPCTCSSTCPAHRGRVPVLLGEQRAARGLLHGLRALRVRYQGVQDVVRATNRAYGGFILLASTTALIGGVAFLYSGVIVVITFAGMLGEYKEPLPFDALDGACALALGTLQTARLLFTCAIGEQMSLESFRISSALQTGLTRHAGIDPRIERELQWFIRQTQMQEIRFGAFDLLYFDLKTMNRIIAAIMTNIAILVQFSALSAGITQCN
ncbi:uncharacterized protein LOC127749173 isoform X2 [Frankliniella occidentalis]|uniref:Gustatory receptor n=1 Tax=Frankliniella occidentalis TaxID=133901 RepID=A0A9C6WZ25_FRAOC|nr:uncharacterized protein LOC127749173 isoform X2 [Frankliniella occidentalis]